MNSLMGILGGGIFLFSLLMSVMFGAQLLGFNALTGEHSPGVVFACLVFFLAAGAAGAWLTRWAFKAPPNPDAPPEDRNGQVRLILNLAKSSTQDLTVLQVASETGLSIDQSRKILEDLVTEGLAQMIIDDEGVILFAFPELRSLRPRPQAQAEYLPPREQP